MTVAVPGPGVALPVVRWRRPQLVALALVVVCVLLAAWGTPVRASEASFGAALRSGQVRAVSWDSHGRYGLELGTLLRLGSNGPGTAAASTVVWVGGWGKLYRTDVSVLAGLSAPTSSGSSTGTGGGARVDVVRSILATAAAARVPAPTLGSLGVGGWLGWPLVLLGLAGLVLLVTGPQPRRVTKWGLFWVLGLPAGLGLVWWVLRDAPWSPRMLNVGEPAPRERGLLASGVNRTGGGTALVSVLLAGLVLSLAGLGVSAVVSSRPRPVPPQGSVTWSVVWGNGATGTLNE